MVFSARHGTAPKKSFDFTAKELGEHEFDAQKRCIKKREKRSDQHVFLSVSGIMAYGNLMA